MVPPRSDRRHRRQRGGHRARHVGRPRSGGRRRLRARQPGLPRGLRGGGPHQDGRRLAAGPRLLRRRLERLRLLRHRRQHPAQHRRAGHAGASGAALPGAAPRVRPARAAPDRRDAHSLGAGHVQRPRPDVDRLLRVRRGRLPPLPRDRPDALAHARHLAPVAVPHRHPGGLDRHHVRGPRAPLVGLELLRQLRRRRHVRRHQPVHRRRHQQSRRSPAGSPARAPGTPDARRAPAGAGADPRRPRPARGTSGSAPPECRRAACSEQEGARRRRDRGRLPLAVGTLGTLPAARGHRGEPAVPHPTDGAPGVAAAVHAGRARGPGRRVQPGVGTLLRRAPGTWASCWASPTATA